MPKKIYIRTFGCQMNDRDSEVIAGLLVKDGYALVDDEKQADVVIFNTCSVRQHAEDKVWSEIGRISKRATKTKLGTSDQRLATTTQRPIIGLVGCMAQHYKQAIFERAPAVDFVIGPADIGKIPSVIKTIQTRLQRDCFVAPPAAGLLAMTGDLKIWETEGAERPEEIYHTGFYQDKEHAYAVISEGCSNYCSYCVVPNVRGELQNRNYKNILKEIEEAVRKGITKITLLGQNVNAYYTGAGEGKNKDKEGLIGIDKDKEGGGVGFADLLKMVNEVQGLKEFTFVTSHPKDTSIDLFKAMAGCEKLKKSLHLPVQSGSDRILGLMNRGYTRKQYADLVNEYRRLMPDARLTTDIIVGFPTETEEDFLDTYGLMKEVRFDSAYIFKYSPRPNTEAARLGDNVPTKEKERRHKILLDFQKGLWRKKGVDERRSK